MITIKNNIDIIDETDNYDILLVGTNVYGRLSNGWQLDAKLKYPLIHKINIETKYGDTSKLGNVIEVPQENKQKICLLYITKGYGFRPDIQKDYLEYDALENCLRYINIMYKGKKIASPILGNSKFDGNGDKERILEIFNRILTDVDITLYDYTQTSAEERKLSVVKKIMDAKTHGKEKGDKTEYYRLIKEKKEYENKLKQINNLKIFNNNEEDS